MKTVTWSKMYSERNCWRFLESWRFGNNERIRTANKSLCRTWILIYTWHAANYTHTHTNGHIFHAAGVTKQISTTWRTANRYSKHQEQRWSSVHSAERCEDRTPTHILKSVGS